MQPLKKRRRGLLELPQRVAQPVAGLAARSRSADRLVARSRSADRLVARSRSAPVWSPEAVVPPVWSPRTAGPSVDLSSTASSPAITPPRYWARSRKRRATGSSMSTGAPMSSIIMYVRKPSDAAPRSPDPLIQ
jgi:hypothetical protein